MEKKELLNKIPILLLLIFCCAIYLGFTLIKDSLNSIEVARYEELIQYQRQKLKTYKAKKGYYPETSSYAVFEKEMKKNVDHWPEISDQEWGGIYIGDKENYSLTLTKGGVKITCLSTSHLCTTNYYR